MKRATTMFVALFLAGCGTPYLKVGAGQNLESGPYGFDERCILGLYGAGVESAKWAIEYEHTSCFDARPELVTNQIRVVRKFSLGRQGVASD